MLSFSDRMGDMVLSTEAISFIIDGNLDGRAKGADPTLSLWNTIQEGGKFVIPYSLSSDLSKYYKVWNVLNILH